MKHQSKAASTLQDADFTESDCEDLSSAKKVKTNKHGQQVFRNGVVSMRELDLFAKISSKQHYEGAILFETPIGVFRLNLDGAYTLCTLVRNKKTMSIEKHRDADVRTLLFLSVAPYALTQDQIDHVVSCDARKRDAWLLGYARSYQQKLW